MLYGSPIGLAAAYLRVQAPVVCADCRLLLAVFLSIWVIPAAWHAVSDRMWHDGSKFCNRAILPHGGRLPQ
jgi:hypothetical protein